MPSQKRIMSGSRNGSIGTVLVSTTFIEQLAGGLGCKPPISGYESCVANGSKRRCHTTYHRGRKQVSYNNWRGIVTLLRIEYGFIGIRS